MHECSDTLFTVSMLLVFAGIPLSGVDMFSSAAQAQFIHQPGSQQTGTLSRHSGVDVGPDVTYGSVDNEIQQQLAPWAFPGTSEPFTDSPYGVPQSTFHGPLPDVSLRSGLPGSCGTGFEPGSAAVTGSVHATYVGLPRSHEMLPAVSGPIRLPLSRPTEQQNAYLYDGKQLGLTYPSVVSVADSIYTQQGLPRQPTQLANVFPSVQPMPHDHSAHLAPSTLHLDQQQPVRLFVPPPPQPPLVLTSGQPSSLPVAVRAPLALVQETATVEQVQPLPVLPVPAQFMMERPRMPVHVHQVPPAGLVTEQSVRLQSSTAVGLMPPFLSDPRLQRPLTPRLLLQEAPSRPPPVVEMPPVVQAGEVLLGPQRGVSDIIPGQIRLPVMPQSLVESDYHPVERQMTAPQLTREFAEVQPILEPWNNANLTVEDSPDQSSARLHSSQYPGSRMLPDWSTETWQQSDRQFGISSQPLVAPGQVLEECQSVSQTRRLLAEPSAESLLLGRKPLQVSDLRSQELGRVPDVPVMEHDDLSSDVALGHLEQRGPLYSASSFSSRLPAPAVVMASSQIIGSRFPDDRFPSGFRCHDFADERESNSSLDHVSGTSVDRIRSSGHLSEFASTSRNTSFQQFAPDRTRVPSLLDENLLEMSSQSSSRRWNDRSGGEMMTVGELRESLRQHDDVSRRRVFHHSTDEDAAPKSSYKPRRKFTKYADDTVSESNDVPLTSDSRSDSHDDKDAVSASPDAASAAVSSSGLS